MQSSTSTSSTPRSSSRAMLPQGLDAQANFLTELTRRSYDFTRRLSEMNLRLFQQLVQDTSAATRQLMSCTDPFQLMAAAANAGQPAFDHLRTYQQEVASLMNVARPTYIRSGGQQHQGGQELDSAAEGGLTGGDPFTNASRADGASGAASFTHAS